ncbi:Gfo/Idh/MocA family protein [Bdellovibrio bacteriovorus]|uniref:Oxidoreductase family protein n=1 Tax=Bdellovibrio bacteriovorus str. Tiberius TaxID=1069642 RepID=K7YMX4_BDEBC|nr:Gfo/Idh/MocA family oxidoreductase [Bdellovibrio bacteriovorus]AFY01181.1 oxidoreductase family protein [Bdellovibrio bacteriovorus str. Tiberius]
MSKKLRGAVVGVGYLGNFHAQKYKNNPNVELVGVCDHFPAQADKIAAQLGVKSFHKPQDLIGEVDLVTIAASTMSHFELAKMFLENGIHVNVEKPITATVPQAEELLALAAKKNLKVAVGHIERFNPAINDLQKHLKNPKFIELNRMAPYNKRGSDVSVLHDLMIHDMDLLFWLTGSEIESMVASGTKLISKHLDTASASFKMKNGVHVVINVSRVSPVAQRSIRVLQDDCTLFAQTGTLEIEKVVPGAGGDEFISASKWSVEKADALQRETDAFIDCVLNDKQPVVTGLDGLKALKAIEDVQRMIEG